MAHIFISYAREDLETAKTLAHVLERQGWSVWWDRRIATGSRFHEVIEHELTKARCIIALWSKAALASDWVREEAQEALNYKKLVPARIEAILPPIGFRSIQAADLISWQGNDLHPGFQKLLNDISELLGTSPRPEPLPPLRESILAKPRRLLSRLRQRAEKVYVPAFWLRAWPVVLGVLLLALVGAMVAFRDVKLETESSPSNSVQISVLGTYGREYDVYLDGKNFKGRTNPEKPVTFSVPVNQTVSILCKHDSSEELIPEFTARKDDIYVCGR